MGDNFDFLGPMLATSAAIGAVWYFNKLRTERIAPQSANEPALSRTYQPLLGEHLPSAETHAYTTDNLGRPVRM
jgi:hypothetical protein